MGSLGSSVVSVEEVVLSSVEDDDVSVVLSSYVLVDVWSCCVYYDVSASEIAVVESDELVSELVV